MGATVSLRGVTKDFDTPGGSIRAVDNVSLDIGSGEVFGITPASYPSASQDGSGDA